MRRSVIIILIGAISTLTGFTTIDYLRQRRCGELLGTWDAAARRCALPSGEVVGTGNVVIFLSGLVVAAGIAFMLHRMMVFATGQMKRSASGS